MSAPYYADDLVTLYHGDCREITEWLAADVLVTDPPYGRAWKQGNLHPEQRLLSNDHVGIRNDRDTTVRDEALAMWGDRRAIVFGDLMLAPPIGTRQVLIFRKQPNAGTRGAMGGFRRDVEAIYLVGPWPAGMGGRTSVIGTSSRSAGNPSSVQSRYGHPHAKPVDTMEELVMATEGVIADPTAGTCSTLIAAKQLGRRAIGVEIDERYCEIAAKRFTQDTLFGGAAVSHDPNPDGWNPRDPREWIGPCTGPTPCRGNGMGFLFHEGSCRFAGRVTPAPGNFHATADPSTTAALPLAQTRYACDDCGADS